MEDRSHDEPPSERRDERAKRRTLHEVAGMDATVVRDLQYAIADFTLALGLPPDVRVSALVTTDDRVDVTIQKRTATAVVTFRDTIPVEAVRDWAAATGARGDTRG